MSWVWWHTLVPVTWEVEVGASRRKSTRPCLKNILKSKRLGDAYLFSKYKVLSSNSSITKKKKEGKELIGPRFPKGVAIAFGG
jgi:hypothetical protein